MMSGEAADGPFVMRLSLGGDGLRVAVKDTIDIAGYPTRAGSLALADAPPASRHAEVVKRVLDAGCRIVGKARLHELAFGVTGINDVDGTPLNPNFPLLIPGGSSSGSAAAVAAGLADFALGTDTGGSVRTPAACCGVFGFKPTFGRVSRDGVMPAHSTLDCVGVFAATLDRVVQAMEIVDLAFAAQRGGRRPTFGVVSVSCDGEIGRAVEDRVARSGAAFRRVTLPGMAEAFDAGLAVINAENWAALHSLLGSGRVGADVAARVRAGEAVTKDDLARAEDVRRRFRTTVDAMLEEFDALILPTMPIFPPNLEDARRDRSGVNLSAFVRPFNLSGHPALSIPMLFDVQKIAGLQLVGRMRGDAELLACASYFVRDGL